MEKTKINEVVKSCGLVSFTYLSVFIDLPQQRTLVDHDPLGQVQILQRHHIDSKPTVKSSLSTVTVSRGWRVRPSYCTFSSRIIGFSLCLSEDRSNLL